MASDVEKLNRMQMHADDWKVVRVEITEDRLLAVYDDGTEDALWLPRCDLCDLMKIALQEAG